MGSNDHCPLYFGFSSGFFTYGKYGRRPFNLREYWQQKLFRLGFTLLLINTFLLILFLIQDRANIWSWHTLINVFGFSGYFTFFQIPNKSPFGRGLWFLTLLLIFYLVFPILKYLNQRRYLSYLWAVLSAFLTCYLQEKVVLEIMLWPTALGFVGGIFSGRNGIKLPISISTAIVVAVLSLFLFLNYYLGIKTFNFYFILTLSLASVYWLMNIRLPTAILRYFSFFSICVLEIYIIHSYLIVKGNNSQVINFTASVVLILFTAKLLQIIASLLKNRLLSVSSG